MPKVDGFKQALEMLSRLDFDSAQKLLDLMEQKDPELAQQLKNNLITLEDLRYITPKMLVELLREVSIDDFALAMRVGSQELQKFILDHVSRSMGEDIQAVIQGPKQPKVKVAEAMSRVMDVVQKKVERKELIIDRTGEKLV